MGKSDIEELFLFEEFEMGSSAGPFLGVCDYCVVHGSMCQG